MAQLTELEGELAELRAAYEQYFMGNERLPPLKKHDAFKKTYQRLKSSSVRQTAVKFRLESIGQKLLTFERLWDRTLKEIENGTYKRDLLKMKRRQQVVSKRPATSDAFDIDEDLDLSDLDAEDDLSSAIAAAEKAVETKKAPPVAPVTPAIAPVTPGGGVRASVPGLGAVTNPFAAKPAAATPAANAGPPKITSGSFPAFRPATATTPAKPVAATMGGNARPDGGLSEQKIKAIYDAYVTAKKRCGEDTRAVTFDAVASSLKKQVPELMRTHNAKSVEFKVVIKDGKAVLRALPKE